MPDVALFKHQREGITFLEKNPRAILADAMGLGKSRQAIIAAGTKSEDDIIVVCPASLKINWQREILMAYPDDIVEVVNSGPEVTLSKKAGWHIINYDMLQKYKEQLLAMEIGTLIIDEAHYIKGKKTIRADMTIEIADKAKAVYCLTGTPIMNRPIELFNLLRAIKHPLATDKSPLLKFVKTKTPAAARREYGTRYCGAFLRTINRRFGKTIRFWDESGSSHLDELKKELQGFLLRRTKEEVLDLPPKIITTHEMEFPSKEWEYKYETAWDKYIEWVANNPDTGKDLDNIMSAQQLVELGKLKQVCSLAKIERILEDVENAVEQGEKVIVFSQYTETIKLISEQLTEKKIGNVTLTGQHNMQERQEAVDDFQNRADCKAFIANIKAGGVGINLTAATIVMFADMDWSPSLHDQAMDRAHRIGQKGTVSVYYYAIKGTVEEDIMELLHEKRQIVKDILEGETTEKGSIMKDFLKRINQRMP